MYITRLMTNDTKIYKSEEDISQIKWDIIGPAEVGRKGGSII